MPEFMSQIIWYLLALLIGAAIGWTLSKSSARKAAARERENLENKVRSYERDLDKTRGELRTHRDQLNSLRSELSNSTVKLKNRDSEINELQTKLKSFELVEADLRARKSELGSLNTELDSLRKRLAEAEVELKRPVKPDANMVAEMSKLKQSLAGKDNEISTLLNRVKELAPLNLQIKDRDLKRRELEAKHAEVVKLKENEIAKLNSRLAELENAGQQARSQAASIEARLNESETTHQSALNARDNEISVLVARIKELEAASASVEELAAAHSRIVELEEKLQSVDAGRSEELRSKEAEISQLQTRVRELEPLNELNANREAEITQLKERVNELEGQGAQLSERDAKIDELQAKLSAGESEVERLRAQVDEFTAQLRDAESRLSARESDTRAEEEIARLRSRITDLETMHNRAFHPPPKEEWDDLVDINGVGPMLVKMLHRMGIYTFKQVAIWNDEQIDWVDSQLERFHGRIRRENWVESAKEQHFKKYGERI
jgi:predicted flap endonuclease-1-like 5' DNA nuclease/uncharacterized membrane-anchored protein YhcB (DUF1043 family)